MELEIKSFYSADIDDLCCWSPDDLSDIYFNLEIEIGEKDKEESYFFQLRVASPEGIRAALNRGGANIPDRAILVVSSYDWKDLMNRLTIIVDLSKKATWDDALISLQKYFRWEYEESRGVRPS